MIFQRKLRSPQEKKKNILQIFGLGLVSRGYILLRCVSLRAQYQSWALGGLPFFFFWPRWIGRIIWLLERWKHIKPSRKAVRGWPTKFSDFE